ncbi:methane/phenol/toluene hydroxylase [Pseudomonas sp. CFT9]|nr:methane/phenol/toluene hydroxylase [Pseudomonas sp. CFT9]
METQCAHTFKVAWPGFGVDHVDTPKLFLAGVSPLEYGAFQGYSRAGRQFSGAGARVACQMQAIDELRHVQTQIHAMSHYNKHFQIWR